MPRPLAWIFNAAAWFLNTARYMAHLETYRHCRPHRHHPYDFSRDIRYR